jgi:hypothetical protein
VKLDDDGRRVCEYPYCKNYAESKGVRNGERRYRPWCEKHRFVKTPTKGRSAPAKAAAKAKPKPAAKAKPTAKPLPKAKTKAKAKVQPKSKTSARRKRS